MSSSTTGDREIAGTLDDQSVESFSWHVRLSENAPHRVIVIVLAALAALIAGIVLFQSLLPGLIGFAIILASTAEFWLGTTYRVSQTGASARCGFSTSSIDWEDVKRVIVEGETVKLSPLAMAGRLDPFRGVTLRTPGEVRGRVLEAAKRYSNEHVRFLGD